jgi:hypothetical protein
MHALADLIKRGKENSQEKHDNKSETGEKSDWAK